ncbi:hypothetical protein PFICI_14264 [Pestalotiopsis fici W106-1]|uniref:Uncharacterized protein n=1 Tax=Pestalotiopsis fici (strain W106-1 / CGMCC3.15140) TaxID=1229662 RepID=W3WKJ3_PESFW|nr:uncharacterized protein PFICI_14264 [Pestalotiopsis fici W106-1]ETS74398.1 hypothetical protein PFICI_14264 [Pestalotiopsis fici W106-1]
MEQLIRTLSSSQRNGGKMIRIGSGPMSVVKMIEAGQHLWKATQDVDSIPKAITIINEAIPVFQVMAKSICDSTKVAVSFSNIAAQLGTIGNLVVTCQGVKALQLIASQLKDMNDTLQAQTALLSIEKFPQAVYDIVEEALHNYQDTDDISNWFFVYHPDTLWTPGFHRLVKDKGLHRRFCGHSNQLDAAIVYMLAAREYSERAARNANKTGKSKRKIRLHLLIPAYQPVLIKDPVRFPEALGDFMVHGKIHNSTPLVWINIDQDQEHCLSGVGRWRPPSQKWFEAMFNQRLEPKTRELGKPLP